jgi:hypothetical protein
VLTALGLLTTQAACDRTTVTACLSIIVDTELDTGADTDAPADDAHHAAATGAPRHTRDTLLQELVSEGILPADLLTSDDPETP